MRKASVRMLRTCCALALLWAVPAFAAEPSPSSSPKTRAPATRAVPSKPGAPAGKARSSAPSAVSPEAVKPAVHEEAEADGNSILGDSLRMKLWQSRILPPDPNEDAAAKATLQSLIQRLRDIGSDKPAAKPPVSATTPAAVAATPKTAKAGTAHPPVETGESNAKEPQPAAPVTTDLPADVAEKLSRLTKDPNQVANPLEMADLLFLNNCMAEAAVFYDRALTLTSLNDPPTADDRAWILFQLGTSLRQTNLARARDIYLKLISEFPNCPWTELAKANGRLLMWYQSDKPQQLISAPTR
jgi:hypothetical protein